MTTPKILPALPPGGLLTQDVDADRKAYDLDLTPERRLLLVDMVAVGTNKRTTTDGRKIDVKYEILHAVEIRDTHERDQLRWRMSEIQQANGYTVTVEQGVLFASDFTEERKQLLSAIDEWADEQELSADDVQERWNSFHGGNYDARLDHGAPAHLREFAISIGALADTAADGTLVSAEPADTEPDVGDEAESEDDEAQGRPVLASVPFSGSAQ